MSGDGIDRRAIAKFLDGIQREFDKRPITLAVEGDGSSFTAGDVIYNGPVFHGSADGAQLAWNNTNASQTQSRVEEIAPGFERIAQAVAKTLEGLSAVGLAEEEAQDAESAARDVLVEVTQDAPDRGKIRRALSALKWALAPVAAGTAVGVNEGAQEWARTAIEQLGQSF